MLIDKNFTALTSDGATLSKVIATLCVVLTHSYKLFKYIGAQESEVFYLRGFHALASCGVMVFFLLSGYFLTVKDNWNYRENIKKKLKSLVVPYFLFILLYTMISMIGSLALPHFFDDFRKFGMKDWMTHLIGIPFVSGPSYYGPLWFLRDLFIFNIFSFILIPAVKKAPGYILFPIMMAIYYMPLPQLTRYSIPLFVIGMKTGFSKKIPVLRNSVLVTGLGIIAFILPIVFEGSVAWKISVFLMTVWVLMISGNLTEKDSIKRMAWTAIPFSFPVYLLHEYPLTTIMRLLAMRNLSVSFAVAAFFIVPVLVVCACVLLIIVWRRLFPRTFALFTGGR